MSVIHIGQNPLESAIQSTQKFMYKMDYQRIEIRFPTVARISSPIGSWCSNP
jgi:hypothetical protein